MSAEKWYIDHEHGVNEIPRGILCHLCNIALERLDTDPSWDIKAWNYLQEHWREAKHEKGGAL